MEDSVLYKYPFSSKIEPKVSNTLVKYGNLQVNSKKFIWQLKMTSLAEAILKKEKTWKIKTTRYPSFQKSYNNYVIDKQTSETE